MKRRGFTFIEILAALVLLALVVPAVMRAMEVSGRAALLARRDAEALRLAETQLHLWRAGALDEVGRIDGAFEEPWSDYRWTLTSSPWLDAGITEWTVEVSYEARGRVQHVRLSTLGGAEGP